MFNNSNKLILDRLNHIDKNITAIKEDVSNIESDLSTVKLDVSNLDTDNTWIKIIFGFLASINFLLIGGFTAVILKAIF